MKVWKGKINNICMIRDGNSVVRNLWKVYSCELQTGIKTEKLGVCVCNGECCKLAGLFC